MILRAYFKVSQEMLSVSVSYFPKALG